MADIDLPVIPASDHPSLDRTVERVLVAVLGGARTRGEIVEAAGLPPCSLTATDATTSEWMDLHLALTRLVSLDFLAQRVEGRAWHYLPTGKARRWAASNARADR